MPLDRTNATRADRPAAVLFGLAETVPLRAAKRLAATVLDQLLDELGRADALALVDWVADDATARRLEMEGDTCAARG